MDTREAGGMGFTAGRWPLDPDRCTLIFIHGSGGTHVLWDAQIDALSERANTVALDLPGRGLSGGPGLRTMPDYARAVTHFVEAIDAPRPVPCGLSLGGGIVLQLLLDSPERFAAGILIGTGARLRVMPAILEGIQSDYESHLAALPMAASPRTDPGKLTAILEGNAQCPADVALGDFLACDAFDVMSRLDEIAVPVLIVSGEDDMLTPPKYADFLERGIRDARRARIADAGHLAPAEKPEDVNAALVGFLDATGL